VNRSYGTRPSFSVRNRNSVAPLTSASFRDPVGSVILLPDRVLRLLSSEGWDQLHSFLQTDAARELMACGQLVATHAEAFPADYAEIVSANQTARVVEHERISPRSFPYEWSPAMLYAAAELTLDLANAALDDGYSLKDATPYNILFRGPHPVFVDVLSFERRDPHDPTWLPLNQFVRTFLLPLLMNKYFGLRLDQLLLSQRDGLEPAEIARVAGAFRALDPFFLSLVFLPAWLGRKRVAVQNSIYQPQRLNSAERARFVLDKQLARLRRQLRKLKPGAGKSQWSGYMEDDHHFSHEYLEAKTVFVKDALEIAKPRKVLDIGCNTGHFALLAADMGAEVVAIDQDPVVIDRVWQHAQSTSRTILPLVVNLGRPTPAVGWRNSECPSFLDRARGHFDVVLMLAVLHHLLVTEQIPLDEILALAAELTSQYLILEFVTPSDPMFLSITRGRQELYNDLTKDFFARVAAKYFTIVRSQPLTETRFIYLLRKRDNSSNV
jgi:2-polyprenyl-3-methyl-5-hydroxy-6-metoxy-1,4-benzoquinol methylase